MAAKLVKVCVQWMEEQREEVRIQIQNIHTSTPALVGEKPIKEIWDDMALRTVTRKENEKETGDLSSDTKMNTYLAESQTARITCSNEIIFSATESQLALVGTDIQDHL